MKSNLIMVQSQSVPITSTSMKRPSNNSKMKTRCKMQCRICNDKIDIEDDSVWALNPLSFRYAIMHIDCLKSAYEDLQGQVIKGPYEDAKDKYDSMVSAVYTVFNGICRQVIP